MHVLSGFYQLNYSYMKNILFYAVMFVSIISTFNSCEDKTDYDISWPQPVITNVSSYSQALSSTITLKGDFAKLKGIYFGSVSGDNLTIAADGTSLTVDVPRTIDPEGAAIVAVNEYSQRYETVQKFIPIILATTVTKVSDIQVGLSFIVEGTNVDLLTSIWVNGTEVSVASKGLDRLVVSVAGLDLKPGSFATVTFKSLGKDNIPDFEKINIVSQFITYQEVVIWDFSDGTQNYEGDPTASIKTGDVLGKDQNYFSLRAPGYGWDKETGHLRATEIPDLSGLVDPYLTFAIRTPAGSAGYFQMQDQTGGNYRHFGFGFDTGGEWVIISQPLNDNWGNEGFNQGSFKPELGFKAGNAGAKMDIDVAYVKITEGKYNGSQEIGEALAGSSKPNVIKVMDFETANEWPDVYNGDNKIGSLDFRNTINPFIGNGFFTYIDDDSVGGWGAYWDQTISKVTKTEDLTVYDNPFLSFAVNTISSNQYIIIRIYQYDEKLVMIKKFFPNTMEKWQTFEFSLFQSELENWSAGGTPLGDLYKSLKRLNPDVAIDRIEVIIGRNDTAPIGISLDEMVVTEGPRYNN